MFLPVLLALAVGYAAYEFGLRSRKRLPDDFDSRWHRAIDDKDADSLQSLATIARDAEQESTAGALEALARKIRNVPHVARVVLPSVDQIHTMPIPQAPPPAPPPTPIPNVKDAAKSEGKAASGSGVSGSGPFGSGWPK